MNPEYFHEPGVWLIRCWVHIVFEMICLVALFFVEGGVQSTQSLVSIWPRSSTRYCLLMGLQHTTPCIAKSATRRGFINLVGTGLTGDAILVVLVLAGQTISERPSISSVPDNLRRRAILRGHGGATRRPELAGSAMMTTGSIYGNMEVYRETVSD